MDLPVLQNPSSFSTSPTSFASKSGLAAIFWLSSYCRMTGLLAKVGRDFVAVKFGSVYIVSVYIFPNRDIGYFLTHWLCKRISLFGPKVC